MAFWGNTQYLAAREDDLPRLRPENGFLTKGGQILIVDSHGVDREVGDINIGAERDISLDDLKIQRWIFDLKIQR